MLNLYDNVYQKKIMPPSPLLRLVNFHIEIKGERQGRESEYLRFIKRRWVYIFLAFLRRYVWYGNRDKGTYTLPPALRPSIGNRGGGRSMLKKQK